MEVVMLSKEEYENIIAQLKEIKEIIKNLSRKSSDEFVDNDELVKRMKISRRTLQNWREEGLIPHSKIGNKIYYRVSDVEELLMRHQRSPFQKISKKIFKHQY